MSKKEEFQFEKIESLVSILLDEVSDLKKQNKVISEMVTNLKGVADKPRRIEYVLKTTGLDKKIEDSKGFVREITSSVKDARSIIGSSKIPKWFYCFAVFTAFSFLLSSLTLYYIIDDVFSASEFKEFVLSNDRLYEIFLDWKKKQ